MHSWIREVQGATDRLPNIMNTNANVRDQVYKVHSNSAVTKYLSDEIAVNHCVLKIKGDGVLNMLTRVEAIPHLCEAWRWKFRTVLVRTQESQPVPMQKGALSHGLGGFSSACYLSSSNVGEIVMPWTKLPWQKQCRMNMATAT